MIGREFGFNRAHELAQEPYGHVPRAEFGKDRCQEQAARVATFTAGRWSGVEISIMFEMKNEGDETATKKKNIQRAG